MCLMLMQGLGAIEGLFATLVSELTPRRVVAVSLERYLDGEVNLEDVIDCKNQVPCIESRVLFEVELL